MCTHRYIRVLFFDDLEVDIPRGTGTRNGYREAYSPSLGTRRNRFVRRLRIEGTNLPHGRFVFYSRTIWRDCHGSNDGNDNDSGTQLCSQFGIMSHVFGSRSTIRQYKGVTRWVSAYQFGGGAACYPKYTKSFGDVRSASYPPLPFLILPFSSFFFFFLSSLCTPTPTPTLPLAPSLRPPSPLRSSFPLPPLSLYHPSLRPG